jgi:hypothetical protein
MVGGEGSGQHVQVRHLERRGRGERRWRCGVAPPPTDGAQADHEGCPPPPADLSGTGLAARRERISTSSAGSLLSRSLPARSFLLPASAHAPAIGGEVLRARGGAGPVHRPHGDPPRWRARTEHYRNPRLCREQNPLRTGLIALGTTCAKRELSAERSRHRWAGKGGSAVSQGPNSRHSCAESPLSSRHRAIHS